MRPEGGQRGLEKHTHARGDDLWGHNAGVLLGGGGALNALRRRRAACVRHTGALILPCVFIRVVHHPLSVFAALSFLLFSSILFSPGLEVRLYVIFATFPSFGVNVQCVIIQVLVLLVLLLVLLLLPNVVSYEYITLVVVLVVLVVLIIVLVLLILLVVLLVILLLIHLFIIL